MSRFDGTGPNGSGPKTGRGLGYCDFSNQGQSLDQGFGRGRGRCQWRRSQGKGFCQFYNLENNENQTLKTESLNNRKQVLLDELELVEKKLNKLK